jgi:hypothetical protein
MVITQEGILASTAARQESAGLTEGAPHPQTPLPSVFQAAERAAEFFDHLRAHYRETRRSSVEIGADIRLVMDDGQIYDQGSAVIRNISPSGALLSDVRLPKDSYPVSAFKLEIRMKGGDYEGIGIQARPVRFEHKKNGLGVRFEEIYVAA